MSFDGTGVPSRARHIAPRRWERACSMFVDAPYAPRPRKSEMVATPDGLQLAVQEWGNPEGPGILFIHGLGQSHLTWSRQIASDLARNHRLITYDLRGHGYSSKPLVADAYLDGRKWADDVAVVIEATRLHRPVLVGWSLGARMIRQYLAYYGDGGIGGINIVDARPIDHPEVNGPGSLTLAGIYDRGPDMVDFIEATITFIRLCFQIQPDQRDFEIMVAYNMLMPPFVRETMSRWTMPYEECVRILGTVTVPTLVSHGLDDRMTLPRAAEMTAAAIKNASLSLYEGCGHCAFYENAERFNRELAELVARAAISIGK